MRSHTLVSIATLGLATLAGCAAVGPDYRRPPGAAIDRPLAAGAFRGAARREFTDAPVPGAWWRLYDSPELDRLIADALAANTDLRAAAATIARAQAGLSYAAASAGPTTGVQGGVAYARPSAEEVLRPGKALPDSAVYSFGASVSYQVDLFGQIRRTIEAAQADVASAQAAYDTVRITVVAETTRAYLESCSVARELAVARRLVGVQQESTQVTKKLLLHGRGTAVDVERSASQESQVRSTLPALAAQRQLALYRVAFLVGRLPREIPADAEACASEPRLPATIPVGDGAALLRRRPDIRKAEEDLRSATSRIGIVTADLYPKVTLGASVGSAGRAGHFGDSDTFKFALGPLISWEFPNRSRTQARIRSTESEAQVAVARFDAAVLAALREAESALEVYSRDLERRALLEKARDQALRAANDTQALFVRGRSGYLPVLDAIRTRIATEQALSAVESKVAADQVNLFLALGGGWQAK